MQFDDFDDLDEVTKVEVPRPSNRAPRNSMLVAKLLPGEENFYDLLDQEIEKLEFFRGKNHAS